MEQRTVRRAARWGLTPATTAPISLAVAGLAAVWFSDATRAGAVAGALLLAVTVVLARVDARLVRVGAAEPRQAWRSAVLRRAETTSTRAWPPAPPGPAGRPGPSPRRSAGCGRWRRSRSRCPRSTARSPRRSRCATPPPPPATPSASRGSSHSLGPNALAVVSVTAALGDPAFVFAVLIVKGRRRGRVRPGRVRPPLPLAGDPMTLRGGILRVYRDDGPLARALGVRLRAGGSRRCREPSARPS
ncbi:hypothetical protein [Actinomadura sp. CNU-125]|uniref:hypothetical protein n=1 Tax=Actinomadura sp. CNU-125 TaxID=1904961 RepID=UPI0021CC561B|nr:hypothetical protein [Actinomadura sp. CNU-125]